LQGCQIFLGTANQNGKKYSTLTTKYTKMALTALNDLRVPNRYKLHIPKILHSKAFKSICNKIGSFGMKLYHLATLPSTYSSSCRVILLFRSELLDQSINWICIKVGRWVSVEYRSTFKF
jgi:hypothetical protein